MKQSPQHNFPSFSKTDCILLHVCSEVSKKQSLKALLAKKRAYVAQYRLKKGIALIRIEFGVHPKSHLHIDCVLKKYFQSKDSPKVTTKISTIESQLNGFLGSNVKSDIRAIFVMPITKLPTDGLISSMMHEGKMGNFSIRLTGGNFTIEGSPVSDIKWSLSPKRSKVMIEIRAEKQILGVGNNFLKEQFQWISEQLNLFVLTSS